MKEWLAGERRCKAAKTLNWDENVFARGEASASLLIRHRNRGG